MGTGIYKGGCNHHSIKENLSKIEGKFKLCNGYFGNPGDSSRKNTRHIESENPILTSKNFYDTLTYGSIENKLSNGKGTVAKLKDGSIITYREVSSSDGSPAVDINIKKSCDSGGIKQQKIHFVKKGKKK